MIILETVRRVRRVQLLPVWSQRHLPRSDSQMSITLDISPRPRKYKLVQAWGLNSLDHYRHRPATSSATVSMHQANHRNPWRQTSAACAGDDAVTACFYLYDRWTTGYSREEGRRIVGPWSSLGGGRASSAEEVMKDSEVSCATPPPERWISRRGRNCLFRTLTARSPSVLVAEEEGAGRQNSP
jgi:hypothetical protein